jgi:hypothetical protein
LFNCGLGQATGELIALIRPGIELDENWNLSVETAFENPQVGSVTPIMVTPSQPTTIVAAGVSKGFGFCRKLTGKQKRRTKRSLRRIRSLGPTSWAAFYRRSALDQLGSVDERIDPQYLDLELALGLTSLGYQNTLCDDCLVDVERAMLVTRESELPHGTSAQRAIRRYLGNQGALALVAQSVGAFAWEVVTSPLQPARLAHAFGRLGAWNAAGDDRHFSERIAMIADENRRPESTVLRLRDHVRNSAAIDSDNSGSRRDRHAA